MLLKSGEPTSDNPRAGSAVAVSFGLCDFDRIRKLLEEFLRRGS
jgi:hypothetical protein